MRRALRAAAGAGVMAPWLKANGKGKELASL